MKEEKHRRQILNSQYEFNKLCFRDKQGRPWLTAGFQLEWWELIDKYDRLVIFAPVEHAKTEEIARSYVLRRFAEDPDLNVAIISNTIGQAQKTLGEIAEDIKTNENYKWVTAGKVKPEEREGKFQKWTDSAFIIQREITSKDYSLQATGIHGNILGTRLGLAILDDCNDFENTFTPAQRDKTMQWIISTLLNRVIAGGKIVVIQTTWVIDDIGHTLADKHGFHKVIYQAIKKDGTPLWPEQWSLERLAGKKIELGSIEFDRQMMNKPLSDAMQIFKRVWFDKCYQQGEGYSLIDSYLQPDLSIATGVDLATRKGEEHDLTVFFTEGMDSKGNRRPLNIIARRMEFPEIISTFKLLSVAFPETVFVVENNAAQVYVEQHLKETTGIRVKGFTTGKQKADPTIGVRSMGVDFENSKWLIPRHPEVEKWVNEFLSWSPQAHSGDRLMSSWFADSYLRKHLNADNFLTTGTTEEKVEDDDDVGWHGLD